MKNNNLKPKIFTITIILTLTLTTILCSLPTTIAQEAEKTTYAYLGAIPNPVGINQEVLLHIGISDYLLIATDGFENLTVSVEKPDGSTETLGPFRTDSTGGTGAQFIPTLIGTYHLQTHFPEQYFFWASPPSFNPSLVGNVKYKASVSEVLELVVQGDPIEFYPASPLPDEYWSRPINAQHRSWSSISGNWVTTPQNLFADYNEYAPETAHILWAKPLTLGGITGGELDSHAYDCGDAYRGKYQSPIIIDGVLFYNMAPSGFTGPLNPQQGVVAVDLHTGEELWYRNNTGINFGQTIYWSSPNMHGAFAYIWETEDVFDPATFTTTTNWHAYDPFNGQWVYTLTDLPSMGGGFGGASLSRRGVNGEILAYEVDLANGWMALWNSSNIPALYGSEDPTAGFFGFSYYSWLPEGKTVSARGPCPVSARTPLGISGYNWNVSIPTGLPGGVSAVLEDRIIGANLGSANCEFWGISLESGHEGELLFTTTWTPPAGDVEVSFGSASVEDGIFTVYIKETRAHYGFSTETGALLWGPTPAQNYLDIYYATVSSIAYGKLFSTGASGVVYCYNAKTGVPLWTTPVDDPYNEILWANNWWQNILFITDGKIYLTHEEHSVIDPKPRGAPFVCINAENGDVIWRINGAFRGTHWGGNGIIGDSIIATMDTYDQRVYAIGKGPSATTIEAVPQGSVVMLRGRVTDDAPGTKDPEIALRFPNGVPLVSDASVSEWMKYVYMQFSRPDDVTGVTVKLEAITPSGGYKDLGTTTSDVYGNYGFVFTPDAEGKYMIMATFEGSGAYYGSTDTTYLAVGPAVSPDVPIEHDGAPFITTEVAVILTVAVAAIVIVAFLALRKRK